MISVDEALSRLAEHVLARETERVPVAEALGRTLAAPLKSKVDRPPTAVSAMDGYAVRLTDVADPGADLSVIGEAPAGKPFAGRVAAGEAVRIFTGAPIPDGADHVIMQEHAEREGDRVRFSRGYAKHDFVRDKGRDFCAGDTLLEAGTCLGAFELAMAAAANHGEVEVRRKPRVALLANGDELKPPGTTLGMGEIVNSNPAGLGALVRGWGGVPIDLGIAGDSVTDIQAHIETATDADILVAIGGASVGDHDYMRTAFGEVGFETVFEKIAVKPGKPTWFARRGTQCVLGLPGNPASALVCAMVFLCGLVSGEMGLAPHNGVLDAPLPANGPREAFLRAKATLGDDGVMRVTVSSDQDSSLIRPLMDGNCLVRRMANAGAADAGAIVSVLMTH
ncbi:MAG: molybdopterin molybdotransferase MoeA [Pseudomonadota bacterium]